MKKTFICNDEKNQKICSNPYLGKVVLGHGVGHGGELRVRGGVLQRHQLCARHGTAHDAVGPWGGIFRIFNSSIFSM